jgi:predicted ester cyclase
LIIRADVPPGTPAGPAGAKQYVASTLQKFPDMHVTIEDMIAEDNKVVVRNVWRCTDPASRKKLQFGGIVIWRIADGRIAERWAYLEAPKAR